MKRIEFPQRGRLKQALRREIRRNDDARYDHRLHAVLLALEDCSPYQVARLLGDAPRSVYYWIEQFRRDGVEGLRDSQRPGRTKRLTDPQVQRLTKEVLQSPTVWNYGQQILKALYSAFLRMTGPMEIRWFFDAPILSGQPCP